MSTKSLPDVFSDRPFARQSDATLEGRCNIVVQPSRLFGENGHVSVPKRAGQLGLGDVPKRVPVHYNYREAFGMAEVVYCFPVGQYVQLVSSGACLIEKVVLGTRFKLKDGEVATVKRVDPLMPWPEEHAHDGKQKRRVVGTVKHAGAIVLDVTVGPNVLTCTPNHLFWSVTASAWVTAKSLKRGDLLKGANGQTFPVGGIGSQRKALVDLYNLEVEIDHTYFVGNPPILVHNGYDCIKLPAYEQELVDAERLTVKSAEDVLGGVHGNSLDATGEHSIYAIINEDTGELLHIGETGDLATRFAQHQSAFAKLGIANIDYILLEVTEGKSAARLVETDFIQFFRDALGYDLPFNFGNH